MGTLPRLQCLVLGVSIILVLNLRTVNAATKTTLTAEQKGDIRDFIQSLVDCYRIPGLSLAVVGADDDEQWWTHTQSFGKADIEKDEDVTSKTLFVTSSLTKAFASTLLAILIEESDGKYSWDMPIKDILGDSFLMADELRTNHVTLVDLLSHRVGIARHEYLWFFKFVPTTEELMKRLHLMEMEKGFRTSFRRSNVMYGLAGVVSEKIGGKPWEELIQEKIFDPLGMESSTFLHKMGPEYEGLARVHYSMNNGTLEMLRPNETTIYEGIGLVPPAASIVSNAEDLSKWFIFLLTDGKNASGHRLVPKSGLSFTRQPQIPMPTYRTLSNLAILPKYPAAETYETYGLGWTRGHYRGYDIEKQTGSFIGYESLLTLQRNPGFAIHTVMNGPITQVCTLAASVIHMYVHDVIMQNEPWLDKQTACTFPAPWESLTLYYTPGSAFNIDKTVQPPRNLTDYVGTYGNYLYGEMRVSVNDSEGRLEATAGTSLTHFAMYATEAENVFALQYLGDASFFDTSDMFSFFSKASPPKVVFSVKEDTKEVYQFRLSFTEAVTFEKGLDVSNPPKPDFVKEREEEGKGKPCDNSTAPLPMSLTLIFCILWVNVALFTDSH